MQNSTKLEIAKAANGYAKSQGWASGKNNGVNQLSRISGVSAAYLSRMLGGELTYDNGATISVVQWNKLAKAIDFEIDKSVWPKRNTNQFISTIARLNDAKRSNIKGMIIGNTGCGKTYSFERFKTVNPVNTISITLSELTTVGSFMDELSNAFGVERKASKVASLKSISAKIRNTDTSEHNMVVVFDETENAKAPVLRAIKAFYDAVKDYCSIILLGTPQLITNLERMQRRNDVGIPQFLSRFKANTVVLDSIVKVDPKTNENKTFEEFFADIKDEGLKALLRELCSDYRMLHDYLVPAIEKAEVAGVPLTESFFRMIYNIQH